MFNCLTKTMPFSGDVCRIVRLFRDQPHLFFLDSSRQDNGRGRYSFIGFDPFDVVQHKGSDALERLREKYESFHSSFVSDVTPFPCGAVGFLSYDYGLYHEKIPLRLQDDLNLPDAVFGLYDCILTVDHLKGQLHITSSGLPEKEEERRQQRAKDRLAGIVEQLSELNEPAGSPLDSHAVPVSLESNFTKEGYCQAVQKALGYIAAGDIYQVNLSQRFHAWLPDTFSGAIELYESLRRISPSAFGAFFDCCDFQIISSSPELFLRLQDGVVQTRPMKGTRPRGVDIHDDQRLRREIVESAKEQAELLMVTDLERNDLGKVCEYGSVRVKEMRTIEEYETVFQATSMVEGRLRSGKDAFDVLAACFPGGSITGCPKIRAMQIIEELEPTRRGIYTGALGYISFAGNMEMNILIRTMLKKGRDVYFQVGGGIVADSLSENEYEETLVKACAMQTCLQKITKSPSVSVSA